MELAQLRTLRAVAEMLNFTRAAERLGLTQSAVSHQIKSLEAELGEPLFVRAKRGVLLSEVGRAALPVYSPSLQVRELFEDELVLVAGPRHRLAGRGSVSVRDLAAERLVLFERGSSIRRATDAFFHRVGVRPALALESNDTYFVKLMVEHGLGISLLPAWAVREEVASGRLVRLAVAGHRLRRPAPSPGRRGRRAGSDGPGVSELCAAAGPRTVPGLAGPDRLAPGAEPAPPRRAPPAPGARGPRARARPERRRAGGRAAVRDASLAGRRCVAGPAALRRHPHRDGGSRRSRSGGAAGRPRRHGQVQAEPGPEDPGGEAAMSDGRDEKVLTKAEGERLMAEIARSLETAMRVEPSADFLARVRRRVADEGTRAPAPWPDWWWRVAAPGLVVLAVIGAALVGREAGVSEPGPVSTRSVTSTATAAPTPSTNP